MFHLSFSNRNLGHLLRLKVTRRKLRTEGKRRKVVIVGAVYIPRKGRFRAERAGQWESEMDRLWQLPGFHQQ